MDDLRAPIMPFMLRREEVRRQREAEEQEERENRQRYDDAARR